MSAENLKPLLTSDDEIALLDVREHGQYGEGHPFFSIPFPYSRLEAMAPVLLPGKLAHLVLLDDADGVAERAAAVFESLGYQNVSVLEGGAPAWAGAGFTLYKGVNVISKTYGELLEHVADTPRLTAKQLHELRTNDPSVVVLDGRSPAEYRKMSLPRALCCPNAELGYRIQSLVPDDATTIVINCAGRTRSILGAEGLRMLNMPNPVFALENGTQGWRLAGLELMHGVAPQELPEPNNEQFDAAAQRARSLIAACQLELVSAETLSDWQRDPVRTTYSLDVRTSAEFDAGHWPGAHHAPGGQLVQATDQYVAVRNARIVLSDDNHIRAATTAIRLQDMGHDVYLLDVDARTGRSVIAHDQQSDSDVPASVELPGIEQAQDMTILDASDGMSFREGHIDGAQWVTRSRVAHLGLERDKKLLLTGRDRTLISGVAAELEALGFTEVQCAPGSAETWAGAGYDIVATPDIPSDEDCIDYLFFVHDRHDGNMDAARRYLEWETGLIDQLDAQERSVLNPRTEFTQE
ncbi:MAG: rhodanese-like domain-containing protein [Woeseiaceae bacterium]